MPQETSDDTVEVLNAQFKGSVSHFGGQNINCC